MRIIDVHNTIIEALKSNIVKVRFTKSDGSIRDMRATLLDKYITVKTVSKSSGPAHLITVWDLDKDSWRSFKINSVINYEVDQEHA